MPTAKHRPQVRCQTKALVKYIGKMLNHNVVLFVEKILQVIQKHRVFSWQSHSFSGGSGGGGPLG